MPRLPVPGSDDGQWGEILNAFLRVVHNDDGSLKTPSIPLSDKGEPDGVAELDSGGKVPTAQLPDAALVGDATPSQKGIIQLAGDLDNTASVPRVANGAITNAKVSDSAAIAQSKIANLSSDLNGKVDASGDTMTGGLTINSSASTTVGSGTSQLTITPSSSLSGASLLYFNTDRPWGFTQQATGAGTALELRTYSSDKYFRVNAHTGTYSPLSIYASTTSTSNAVGIGMDPTPGGGRLQFAAGTTPADGITLGVDTNLYRTAANALRTDDAFIVGDYVAATSYIAAYNATSNQVALGRTASGIPGAGITFGSSQDVNIYRSGADTLKTDDNLLVGGTGNFSSTLSYPVAQTYRSSVTTVFQARAALADTVDRFIINSDGGLAWGSGSGATDAFLYRRVAGVLSTGSGNDLMDIGSGGFVARRVNTTDNAFVAKLYSDSTARLYIAASGQMSWANGTGAADTNLYRSAADTLKTDDNFEVGGTTYAQGNLTIGSGSTSVGLAIRASSYNGVTTDVYSDTASAYSFFRRARGSFSTPTATTNGSFLGSFGFRSHDGTNFLVQDSARISGYATQTTSTTHGGAIGFYTAANGTLVSSGASERLTIYHDGNIGIGVAAPTFKLQLAAATTAAGGIGFGTDVTLYRSAADVLKTDDRLVVASGITPRVNTLVVATNTYTPNCDTTDVATITDPTAAFTVANPAGTAQDGQELTLRIKSSTTGYAPTWGTGYQASGMTVLPTTALPASKTVVFKFQYDATPAKWILLAYDSVGY